MRAFWLLSAFLASLASAEVEQLLKGLDAEEFQKRQKAEAALVEWVQAEDSKGRTELLFRHFLGSEDPELFRRLTQILLVVHLEHKKEEIPRTGSGFIGISMSDARQQLNFRQQGFEQPPLPEQFDPNRGVYVDAVIKGTPAEMAGVKAGDLITEIDNESIAVDGFDGRDPTDLLKEIVGGQPPGTKITLTIERGEEVLKKEVTLMNAGAIPLRRRFDDEPRVDSDKARELLEADYLQWLFKQRDAYRAAS